MNGDGHAHEPRGEGDEERLFPARQICRGVTDEEDGEHHEEGEDIADVGDEERVEGMDDEECEAPRGESMGFAP